MYTVRTTSSFYMIPDNAEEGVIFVGTGNFIGFGNMLANFITGGAGDDQLVGGLGNDSLYGGAGADWLYGGDGNDSMNGGAGADYMDADEGNDIYYVDDIGDVVGEGGNRGIDTVRTTLLSYTLSSYIERLIFTGTGNFTGIGNALANVITGGAGDDALDGGDGNDRLNGGAGADAMTGGAGNDNYSVDNIGDTVTELPGGGIDTVRTTLASYTLGDEVDRVIFTGTGNFTGIGNGLANVITGGAGDDTLEGDDGNDRLNGGAGTDEMTGGAGNDTYYVDNIGDSVTELPGGGIDTVRTTLSSYTLGAEFDRVIFTSTGNFTGTGNALANVLTGGAGNDTLIGLGGNDRLDGGPGADTMVGGAGNDAYYVDNVGDTVTELAGEGIDTVRTTLASYTLGTEVERLTFAGTGNFTGIGNGLANIITGGAGNDTLEGGDNDTLKGGGGNDTLLGGQNDTLLDGGADIDALRVAGTFTSKSDGQIVNVEDVTLTAASTLNLAKQTEGFTITGSSGADGITSGSGNDTIVGAQNDTLLNGGGGTDTLQLGANFTSTIDGQIVNIENVTLTVAATLNLANQTEGFVINGSSGADHITGSSGADAISGDAGDDTIVAAVNETLMDGGADTDTLQVGANFISASDGQIVNVERVLLTQAAALDLTNQSEGFTVTGSAGADSIRTGAGNDTIVGGQNDTLLDGGGGSNALQFDADFTSTSDAQIVNIVGISLSSAGTLNVSNQTENFSIFGSSGADSITGGSGNDSIYGAQNDTLLDGGGGTIDTLRVSANFTSTGDGQIVNIERVMLDAAATLDLSNQTEGFGRITGSVGVDSITGGLGNDTIVGAQNDALLDGGGGTDTLEVAATFASTADGQIVNIEQVLLTSAGTLDLANQTEGFAITGSSGADGITGGSGADSIKAGAGNDTIVGAQNDTLLDGGADSDTLQLGANFTSTSDGHVVNIESVTLTAAAALNLANQTEGFTITGSSGADSIRGGSGADAISAGAGDDTIAGAQNDTLLDGGADTDTLQVGANFTSVGDGQIVNVERVLLTQAAALDLTNQSEGFTVTGSAGADSIRTGAGNDTIVGGQNDTLLDGGADSDDTLHHGGADSDTLQLGANFTSTSDGQVVNIENVTLTAAATVDLSNQSEGLVINGSSGNDIITGTAQNDWIYAGAGDDIVDGGGRNDAPYPNSIFDLQALDGGDGIDTVTFASRLGPVSVDLEIGAEGFQPSSGSVDTDYNRPSDYPAYFIQINFMFSVYRYVPWAYIDNFENVIGSSFGDTLKGNAAIANVLDGAGGDDLIMGDQGDVRLDGGAGTDTLQLAIKYDPFGDFTSASDEQIVNIEQVVLFAPSPWQWWKLDLANQTEDFTIIGSLGSDIIRGGSGADSISGDVGNDTIAGAQNDTLLDGGGDTDTLQVGANFTSTSDGQIVNTENVTLTAAVVLNLANQTEGFTITGSSGADSITGGSGNDTIVGAMNDTLLDGGGGTDTLQVGANFTSASDGQLANIETVTLTAPSMLNLANQTEGFTIIGSSGADGITGGLGADSISAGAGDDTIVGAGNDTLLDGGADTDTLLVGVDFTSSSDLQIAGIERVVLASPVAVDLSNQTEGFTFIGSAGSDSITSGSGNDVIRGAENASLLDGGGGTDTLQVEDTFTSTSDAQLVSIEQVVLTEAMTVDLSNQTEGFAIAGSSGADSITAGSGNDTIVGAQNDTLLDGNGGTDTLQAGANFTSTSDGQIINIEQVTLTAAAALDLANQTEGFTVNGSSGADSITGGSGTDAISAGAGDDTIVAAANDTLLDGGADTDTLQLGADFTSSSDGQIVNIEKVVLAAAAVLNLANQTEGLTITGSSGADSITGGSGNDTIVGAQNDVLLAGGGGYDTLQVGANFTSSSDAQIANIGQVMLTSAVAVNLANQTEALFIQGSSGDDTITGGAGADSIFAGSGDDTIVGAQNDTLFFGGLGTNTLQLGANFTSTSDGQLVAIEKVTLTAAAVLNLANQTEDIYITGSSGDDIIFGGAGNDLIIGGLGNDTVSYASAGSAVTAILANLTATGGAGFDTLGNIENVIGSAYDDVLGGDVGNNVLEGGLGNDFMAGGLGIDTVSYASAGSGVTVSLAITSAQNTGGAGIDTLSGFENLTGSAFNDTLTGNSVNNVLDGGGGTDTISYASATSSVTVNMATGLATGGAGTDTFVNFENLTGSAFNDTLMGNSGSNVITGGAGADSLTGGGGNDVFVYEGASGGIDTIADFSHGVDLLNFHSIFSGQSMATLVSSGVLAWYEGGGNTTIFVDLDGLGGAGAANPAFILTGTGLGLTSTDFIV